MNIRISILLMLVLALTLAACDSVAQPTGSANDSGSAANIMPSIQGFTTVDTVEVQDALAAAGISGSALTAPVAAAAIARLDQFADCLRDVGAFSAKVYTNVGQVSFGVLAVVNEERLSENLLACTVNPGGARAQRSITVEPCVGSGRITFQGVSYSYAYVASDPNLCSTFQTHFNNINGQ